MDVKPQALAGWKKYRQAIRRNFVSVIFPVFTVSAIYLDWSRTQRFKKQKALLDTGKA